MMNPSSSVTWSNPPPPGTEVEEDAISKTADITKTIIKEEPPSKIKSISDIDPYLKNPQYIEYEKRISSERSKHKHRRSRSRSHDRRRSRSRSRDRYRHRKDRRRRSRSRSRRSRSHGRRHRYRSRSHSRSRSRHRYRDRRHKRSSSSDNRSSRSSSRSHSYKSYRSRHSRRSRSRRSRSYSSHLNDYDIKREPDSKIEEDEEEEEEEVEPPKENAFKNDGSFLEMFKKLQEQQAAEAAKAQEASVSEVKKPLPIFGKRRGGRVLKTGMVQKTRAMEDAELNEAQDAWSVYMKEVKRYKEACCDDDSKTRPLVK